MNLEFVLHLGDILNALTAPSGSRLLCRETELRVITSRDIEMNSVSGKDPAETLEQEPMLSVRSRTELKERKRGVSQRGEAGGLLVTTTGTV